MEHRELVLQARVERLERRMRVVVAGWVLSVAVFVLLGVAVQQAISQPEVLRARRIEVVDATGRARIVLTVDAEASRFMLRDAAGQVRIGLAVDSEGTGLAFQDAAGRQRIGFSLLGGGVQLFQFGNTDSQHISLAILPNGSPRLRLYGAAGRVLFQAP